MKQEILFTAEELGLIPSVESQEALDKGLYGSTGGKCQKFSDKALAAMGEVFRKRQERAQMFAALDRAVHANKKYELLEECKRQNAGSSCYTDATFERLLDAAADESINARNELFDAFAEFLPVCVKRISEYLDNARCEISGHHELTVKVNAIAHFGEPFDELYRQFGDGVMDRLVEELCDALNLVDDNRDVAPEHVNEIRMALESNLQLDLVPVAD